MFQRMKNTRCRFRGMFRKRLSELEILEVPEW